MTEDKFKKPFTKSVDIRFSQADPGGILFFGNVYQVAHDTYEDFVTHLGFKWDDWFANPEWAVPLRHSSCEHLIPIRPGKTYLITIEIAQIGTSSLTLKYKFENQGRTHCEVTLVHTFIDLKSITKRPIPKEVRERLEVYQSASLSAQ